MSNLFLYLLVYLILSLTNETKAVKAMAKPYPKICKDIHITLFELQRGLDIHALSYCEIILGSITYAPMYSLINSSTPATPIRFPYLREVYGFVLLAYSSMQTFSSMFPRLAIIHGRELYHSYSLIIVDNLLLDDIGLVSLINIRRGNILIARNAQLCYAESLHWNDLFESRQSQIISRQNRKNCAFCPICPSACWSPSQCQKRCPTHCQGNCFSETICCPEQCVGGCYLNKPTGLICHACRHMRIYGTGVCTQQCPQDMLKASESLCVTRDECRGFFMGTGFILEELNECVRVCLPGFLHADNSHCRHCISSPENDYCHGACGKKYIRTMEDLQTLKYCTRIHTLNIYDIDTVEFSGNSYLEFPSLEQIDQEFIVHNVKIFSSLGIFSRLRRIGISENATMTIHENEFLTELWPLTQTPPIVQGSLSIVRNARLCLKKIEDFINHTYHQEKEIHVLQSTYNEYANGYLTTCESNQLVITIDRIRSLTVRVNVAISKQFFFRSTEHLRRSFLSIYYKPTKTKNETHFDPIQSYEWLRLVEKFNYQSGPLDEAFTMHIQLSSLIGDQWYAVYASIISNVNTIGLSSPIVYFRTSTRQPESVVNLHGKSLTSSTVELTWQPPTQSHGPIATYLVYYAPIEDRLPMTTWKLLCLMKDHWQAKESISVDEYNLNQTDRCSQSQNDEIDNEKIRKDDTDEIINDLSILEQQLINSVGQWRGSVPLQQDLKNTIILNLDTYFGNQSQIFLKSSEPEYEEQSFVENKPYINQYNHSISDTKILIENLKETQMYMFQVYACHNLTTSSISNACSINGILTTVRTKPGHPSRDIVRNVKIFELNTNSKSLQYQISWLEPLRPNGLIYFYMIYIEQNDNNGPKQERCVGNDVYSINVTLSSRTQYRLKIITYTIARLNNEYNNRDQIQDELMDLFYEEVFLTKDLSNEINRFLLVILILISIVLLFISIGVPCYYYKYEHSIVRSSISKNPNYELYTPDQWEIHKDSIILERLIGQGHFGQTYQGVLKLHNGTFKPCAIKVRTNHSIDLLQEASIMKQFQCYHVIQLYGVCSRIRPPYVVMELMENGDLKNYLYRHRQKESNLSELAMIQLALDVADGMYYLSEQKFVHRDLAARNCLVNSNHTCKVGDFGLTRDIYETDYYRRGGRSFLPIRWMAPESLRDGRFDTVSDIWSYGVLLWEIATLAEQPYQGYRNEDVVHYVRHGHITLECPKNCPEILHQLMRACWKYSPNDRITFRSIVEELISYENEDFHLHAYYHHIQSNVSL